jgi:hypothetical protein
VTEYNPDNWVVLKMVYKDKTFYKLLAGWSGGYLNGDSWKLNSGIEKVELDNDRYKFYGSSDSVYSCHKDGYGLRMSTVDIYSTMKKTYPDQVEMLEDCDWLQMEWKGKA